MEGRFANGFTRIRIVGKVWSVGVNTLFGNYIKGVPKGGLGMNQSKSAFWAGLVAVAALVFAVRETLILVTGIPQCSSFVLISGTLEIPIPEINTVLGYMLAAIGAVAVTGMTYFVGKCILDKKDTVPIIGGLALGFGIMATGAAESSILFWLPIAVAIGVATAYLSDKFASFPASEALSVGTAIILGATAYMAVGHGLLTAAIIELLLLVCYWLGVFTIVVRSFNDEPDCGEEHF